MSEFEKGSKLHLIISSILYLTWNWPKVQNYYDHNQTKEQHACFKVLSGASASARLHEFNDHFSICVFNSLMLLFLLKLLAFFMSFQKRQVSKNALKHLLAKKKLTMYL